MVIDRTADRDEVVFKGYVTFVARGMKYQGLVKPLQRVTQGGRTCITGLTGGGDGELFTLPEICDFQPG